MTNLRIDADSLAAIDVHVPLEHPGVLDTQDAPKKYFKDDGVRRDAAGLAEYYRSRKMACVIFTVDETLSGTPRMSNDDVIAFAQANPAIAIPFASVNPNRGLEGVREAKRLIAAGVRGLKLHPPIQQFSPDDRV